MHSRPESQATTRAFARIIGPYVFIVTCIIVIRAPQMNVLLASFFESPIIVWLMGALLLFGGLLIIAHHQYWKAPTAIMISLFGWFLGLRGLTLLAAPQLIECGAAASMSAMPLVRIGFGVLSLVGLWFTYVGWIAKPKDV
ncbi:MAG: hypothetical protein ACREPQ_16665 [Rhodanobacter sp.]